ncbi:SDR family oxidoreductase [Ottowia sp. VDI28]|uniref:SDR family oxidoreductase n=1 Tax=Ottowia sp. VDI28 TaxID=3133968 RepID=UPI003C2FFC95
MTRRVLITGAAAGIGRAAAELFAKRGWHCVLVDRDRDALDATVASLPGTHLAQCIDLADPIQIASLGGLEEPLDAVVNNAGIADPSGRGLVEQTPSAQAVMRAVNLEAPGAVVTAVMVRLAPGARIVNVSSNAGLRSIPFRGYYSLTKAGLIGQTLALARARDDLSVSVLCPGFTRTELNERLVKSGRLDPARALAKIPLGRWAEPAELAEAICFLASPGARALRGEVLQLDGGSGAYGGSAAYAPASAPAMSLDLPLCLSVEGDASKRWAGLLLPASPAENTYQAVLDVHALDGGSVSSMHEAVNGFARRFERHASLTFLLPPEQAVDWQRAGESAAMRMMVRTLACELAPRALRVNAIEVGEAVVAAHLKDLICYVAGARAQFLTGQLLRSSAV